MGGYTQNNMFDLKIDYRKLMHDLIECLVGEHDAHIMLVPHVMGANEGSESDVVACQKIFSDSKPDSCQRLHLIEETYDQHEIKALIGRTDFFIGSRMHACIGALSQGVPAVGLAYSKKFKGVFETIGMENLVIDLRDRTHLGIIESIETLYGERGKYHRNLVKNIPSVREAIFRLFNTA
jgi:polysaccharide pyruvyl transferase WcaK-like protein